MTNTQLGLLTGLVLGIAAIIGGFSAFIIVAVLGAVGLIVGRAIDGKLDVSNLNSLLGRGRDQ